MVLATYADSEVVSAVVALVKGAGFVISTAFVEVVKTVDLLAIGDVLLKVEVSPVVVDSIKRGIKGVAEVLDLLVVRDAKVCSKVLGSSVTVRGIDVVNAVSVVCIS